MGRVVDLEQNSRHLTNRREEEFAMALAGIAAEEEGVPIRDVEVVSARLSSGALSLNDTGNSQFLNARLSKANRKLMNMQYRYLKT